MLPSHTGAGASSNGCADPQALVAIGRAQLNTHHFCPQYGDLPLFLAQAYRVLSETNEGPTQWLTGSLCDFNLLPNGELRQVLPGFEVAVLRQHQSRIQQSHPDNSHNPFRRGHSHILPSVAPSAKPGAQTRSAIPRLFMLCPEGLARDQSAVNVGIRRTEHRAPRDYVAVRGVYPKAIWSGRSGCQDPNYAESRERYVNYRFPNSDCAA